MSLTGLVGDVTNQHLFVGESCRQFIRQGQLSTGVVAHINDDAVADGKFLQHLAQVAIAKGIVEATAIDIAHIVVQHFIFETGSYLVVLSQILPLQAIAEVGRIVLAPRPIACHVKGGIEIHMTVTEFGKHIAQHLEQSL